MITESIDDIAGKLTEDIATGFSGMVMDETAKLQATRMIQDIKKSNLTPSQQAECLQAFREKLDYLNDYAQDRCIVHMFKEAFSDWNFSLQFKWETGNTIFGGMQFNGVRQPFASVTLGPFQWFSIHT